MDKWGQRESSFLLRALSMLVMLVWVAGLAQNEVASLILRPGCYTLCSL